MGKVKILVQNRLYCCQNDLLFSYRFHSDPFYTRANDSGFVANPECFDIGFVLPFTLRNMNPIQNYRRWIMNPELSNPEVCWIFVSEKV